MCTTSVNLLHTRICQRNVQRLDLFHFIRVTLRFAAMYPWPLQEQMQQQQLEKQPKHLQTNFSSPRYFPYATAVIAKVLEIAYELFLYFVLLHIWILYVCTIYLNFINQDGSNLELLVDCLIQTIIYFWAMYMKVYFRRVQPQLVKDSMDFINLKHVTHSAAGFTYVTMDECLQLSNKWIKIYVYACFGGVIFWLIIPIVYGDRSLPLPCWYPFDFKAPIVYEIIYFLQCIGQLQIAASFAASSGYFVALAITISGQYDILNCSLKNILATAYIMTGKTTKTELMQLQEQQQIANAEINQYYCAIEKSIALELLIDDANQPVPEINIRAAFKIAQIACVNHHRYILKALEKMELLYNLIWFFKTGEAAFLMCLVAFISVKSSASKSFMKMLLLGQYLLLAAWEFFIICYFSEIIVLNSQRCGEAILRSPWNLHAHEVKNDFLFFILNSQRYFKLTAGKIINLNMDRFRNIMTTAFSFLTVLQKLDQRN